MIYGYARVSTLKQAKDGNGLEAQESALKKNGAEVIYKDVFTGRVTQRPQFDALMKEIKAGDTIIITKLDRIARSTIQGATIIEELLDKDITIKVLNMPFTLDNSSMGKLARLMVLAFAEFERDLIVERTQEGKRIAMQNPNFKDGRPKKYTTRQIMHAIELLKDHSYTQVVEMTGISKATLYREYKKYKEAIKKEDGNKIRDEAQLPGQTNIYDYLN